jgi:ribosomal protein S18 acetylase RimI-like enzyme
VSAVRVRPAPPTDMPFLVAMLAEAAEWRAGVSTLTFDQVLADPTIARYVVGWPRQGDAGVVAEDDSGAAGAAWWRYFSATDHGYGFVDESTPEITVGVRPDARGRGVGAALLTVLADEARGRGVAALSLSVEVDNPAVRLYERAGFEVVERSGGAFTMVCTLT